MNEKAALKLLNNPHYKMSAKQKKKALETIKETPMITFGKLPIHQVLQRKAVEGFNK